MRQPSRLHVEALRVLAARSAPPVEPDDVEQIKTSLVEMRGEVEGLLKRVDKLIKAIDA